MNTKMIYAFSMILFICAFSANAKASTGDNKSVDVQYSSVLPTYLEQHTGIAVDFYNFSLDGLPCSQVCESLCGTYQFRLFACTYTYCDNGQNQGGTVMCYSGGGTDAPADNTGVIIILP